MTDNRLAVKRFTIRDLPPNGETFALVKSVENGCALKRTLTWKATEWGEALRELRTAFGISARDASAILRVSLVTLFGLERGRCTLNATEGMTEDQMWMSAAELIRWHGWNRTPTDGAAMTDPKTVKEYAEQWRKKTGRKRQPLL